MILSDRNNAIVKSILIDGNTQLKTSELFGITDDIVSQILKRMIRAVIASGYTAATGLTGMRSLTGSSAREKAALYEAIQGTVMDWEIKLTDEKVKDVKMMLIYSGLQISEIARYHGISQSQVSHIKCGDCYAHVDLD